MNYKSMALLLGLALIVLMSLGAVAQSPAPMAWDGNQWKEFTHPIKVAYIKGIGNMASFETATGGSGRAACISRAFVEELKTKTVGQIIDTVDRFYQDNPGKLKTPVIEVILQRCTALCPVEPPTSGKK